MWRPTDDKIVASGELCQPGRLINRVSDRLTYADFLETLLDKKNLRCADCMSFEYGWKRWTTGLTRKGEHVDVLAVLGALTLVPSGGKTHLPSRMRLAGATGTARERTKEKAPNASGRKIILTWLHGKKEVETENPGTFL